MKQLLFIVTLFLCGCPSQVTTAPPPPPPVNTITTLAVGATSTGKSSYQITATCQYPYSVASSAKTLTGTLTSKCNTPDLNGNVAKWTNSNSKVVTVSSLGLVTAVAAGTATVQATVGTIVSNSLQFTVTLSMSQN